MKHKFIVFNKQGNQIKAVETDSVIELENELKKKGLYAQRYESFENRNDKWNKKSFTDKLISLGWEFNSKGNLINTEW